LFILALDLCTQEKAEILLIGRPFDSTPGGIGSHGVALAV